MGSEGHSWIVILAAENGPGSAASTIAAISRACAMVPPERVCLVVVGGSQEEPPAVPGGVTFINIIVQPGDRGTANGMLLATLVVTERDPQARLLFMSSGRHFPTLASVPDEPVVFAATGSQLYRAFRQRVPEVVSSMDAALFGRNSNRSGATALQALYENLPAMDFSNDVLPGREHVVRIVRGSACDWCRTSAREFHFLH